MDYYVIDVSGAPTIVGVHPIDTAAFLKLHGHQVICGPGCIVDMLRSVEWNLRLRRALNNLN